MFTIDDRLVNSNKVHNLFNLPETWNNTIVVINAPNVRFCRLLIFVF